MIGLLVLLWAGITVALASDGPKKPTKPTPTVIIKPAPVPQAAPDNDRKSENLYAGAAVSGLLTAHFRTEQYGALKAIGTTTLGAAIIEAGHSGSYNGSNVWYALGGATVGSFGACQLFFRKGFAGCVLEFK